MTQAQRSGARPDPEQGPGGPADGVARRRVRDRVVLTQPPPPPPTPRRPAPDDEEPQPSQPTSGSSGDERRAELLAEIDELVDEG